MRSSLNFVNYQVQRIGFEIEKFIDSASKLKEVTAEDQRGFESHVM